MFACLHLPDLAVEAALQLTPELRFQACAVSSDPGESKHLKAPLLAVNTLAARHGIRVGESSHQARARCPSLRFLPRNREAEQALQIILLELAESLGPDFEQLRPDTLIIDLATSHPPTNWQPPIPGLRLSLANTPDLAHLAAMAGAPCSGQAMKPDDFDPLALDLLAQTGTSETIAFLPILRLWGLRTLGDFRKLPRQQVTDRLGPAAMRVHDILHGRFQRLLQLYRPLDLYIQAIDFESPIDSFEPLLFAAKQIFQTLCARLAASHLAAGKLRFELSFESHAPLSQLLPLAEPQRSPEVLMRLLQAAFETLHAPSGIVALELEFEPVRVLATQCDCWVLQIRHPERWAETLTRLESLLGPDRVGIPRRESSHRPDAFHVVPVAAEPAAGELRAMSGVSCVAPLRRFRPPLEVAVASTGRGFQLRPQALLTGPHAGPILRQRGPFAISGDWWSADAWQGLEWDIELHDRRMLRLGFNPPEQWKIEGIY